MKPGAGKAQAAAMNLLDPNKLILGLGLLGMIALAMLLRPGLHQGLEARERPAPLQVQLQPAVQAAVTGEQTALAEASRKLSEKLHMRLAKAQEASPIEARPVATTTIVSPEAAAQLYAKAETLIRDGDFASARLLLDRAIEGGHRGALFMQAATYDPNVLARVNVRGLKGDADKARAFYTRAADAGLNDAHKRLAALR